MSNMMMSRYRWVEDFRQNSTTRAESSSKGINGRVFVTKGSIQIGGDRLRLDQQITGFHEIDLPKTRYT